MDTLTLLKIVTGILATLLGILSQLEAENEILLVDKSVAIAASRPKVFVYLSDLRNYRMWYPGVRFEPSDEAPMSVGKHFQQTYQMALYGEVKYNTVLTGYESPSYIGFVSDDWLGSRVEMVVSRREDSRFPTLVTWRLYSSNRSYLVKYVLSPVQSVLSTNVARQALLNLRLVFTT